MRAVCALATLCVFATLAADVSVVEEIVAKVNGDIITRSELDQTRKTMAAEIARSGAKGAQVTQQVQEREKDLLRDRVDQLLLVQKGKEMSINVDTQFSKYQADLMKSLGIADQDKFQQVVRENTGQPYEDWRNEARNMMLTQRVIGQEVQSKINISTTEKAKYYEEHKAEFVREERVFLREIFLKTDGKNDAAVEKKVKDLVARAKKGEKFGEMARDNSDAESSKNFGELGGFKRGELDKSIEDAVFAGGRGFVTDPAIRRPNGFLILKVEEVHKAGQATQEEVDNEIMEKLFGPRMNPAVRTYLTQLRQEAFLEIREGYVDSGAAPGKDTKWTDPAQLRPETVSKEELANQKRKKRFLGIPVPGTSTSVAEEESAKGTSSSKTVKEK
jgi:parvulin-like peptidyl-prolyl isomerase